MLRFRSIRSRLTVTFLLAILAVMLIVGFFLDQLIENYYIKSRDNLVRPEYQPFCGGPVEIRLTRFARPGWPKTLAADERRVIF